MTKFTTPCYVRVEDAQKRKELCDNMKSLGYKIKVNCTEDLNPIVVASKLGILFDANTFCEVPEYIDCSTNIELFKALAAMRSDTDKGQIFTNGATKWLICLNHRWCYATHGDCRKATATEIIEHFKTKEK